MTETFTLEPYITRYLESRVRMGEIKRKTAWEMRFTLMPFAEVFGRRPIAQLGRAHVERWLESIGHLAPSTRRSKLSIVKVFCRWLVVQEYLKRDPSVAIRSPRQPRALPKVFDGDEVTKLLLTCQDARDRLIVLLMCQLGLRCIEVSRLEVGDISAEQVRVRGKFDHERVLPLVPEVRAALNVYLGERRVTAGPLIQHAYHPGRGLTSHTIGDLVRRLCRDAGVKRMPGDGLSAHGLRRTCATDMLGAGADIIDVAEALGHANLASVRHYAKYNLKGLETAMAGRTYGEGA
jgi:integrase